MAVDKDLLQKALSLKPQERLSLIDMLIRSLDEPDREIDDIWIEEAERRLAAYREGKTVGIPARDIFEKDE